MPDSLVFKSYFGQLQKKKKKKATKAYVSNYFLPKRTIWKEGSKENNFTGEKSHKQDLGQVLQVNTNSDKSY